ncbi:MAG: hypothetical protein U1E43_02360 [Rhodospirillales bacterium]
MQRQELRQYAPFLPLVSGIARARAARLAGRRCRALLWGFVHLADRLLGGGHRIDQALLLSLRNPADLADPIGPP